MYQYSAALVPLRTGMQWADKTEKRGLLKHIADRLGELGKYLILCSTYYRSLINPKILVLSTLIKHTSLRINKNRIYLIRTEVIYIPITS